MHGRADDLRSLVRIDNPQPFAALAVEGLTQPLTVDQIEELDLGDAGKHRRLVNEATRDEGARYVHVSMRDNAEHLPADYVAAMEATRTTRPF